MHSIRSCAPVPSLARRVCFAILAAAFPFAAAAQSIPYSGTPVTVPATIEAENFDRGGEGVAYRDNRSGNQGGSYRTTESVDIIASCDSVGGGYVVNNFETGEWMKYTINVPVAGNYEIDVRGSSKGQPGAAFHVEVDNVNVTGSVAFPNTGNWCGFTWSPKKTVSLSAGMHVLKLYADKQYINVNSLRVSSAAGSAAAGSTPFTGTPIAVPATIEAENFDKGGEGVAYHDNVKGNAGGLYRLTEDVDIIVSSDSAGGGYVVNNFETGEWMKYTINVPTAGNYDLALRTSTNFTSSAFHIEVDGTDVTGRVTVPYTNDWTAFQWVTGKIGLPLSAGTHVLKVVADQQYFNLNQIRVAQSSSGGGGGGTPPSTLLFRSGYEGATALGAIGDCYPNGCWQDMQGADSTTGFTWPPTVSGGQAKYQLLSNSGSATPTTVGNYVFNQLQTVTGPKGNQTKAMYSQVTQRGGDSTQNPFILLPTSDVPELYISQWIKFQPDFLTKLNGGDQWRDLFEWKTYAPGADTDYRVELQIINYGGGSSPRWMMRGDGWVPSYQEYWRIENTSIPIPMGQWFKLEVYWKRSSGSDGRVWMAVNGQVIGDHFGPNKGPANAPINRIMVNQLYTGGALPAYQWVDDLQIWSTFPSASSSDAWYDPPYAPH